MEEMGWERLAILSRAEMALARGDPGAAIELAEEYGIHDPSSFLVRARALAGSGRFDETMEFLESQTVKIPALKTIRKDIMGFCLTAIGEHERAVRYLSQALEDSRRAHGGAMEIATSFVSFGVIWSARGDSEKARLYLDLAEGSSLRTGRARETLEIRALREAILPQGMDSFTRAKEIAEEARTKGLGVARLWALWAAAGVAGALGLEKEWYDSITSLLRMTRERKLWGYLSYIAQAAPDPLSLALSVYPDDRHLREIASRLSPRSKQARMKLLVMGQPAIETPRGRFHLEKGRPGEVLVFFALHAKGELTRERIIQEFWPRLPLERARRNYYKFTALARAILRNQGVAIKPHKSHTSAWIGCEIRTDLDELRNLVNTAKAVEASAPTSEARPIYEKALSLIRGDFLEGWRPGFLEDIRDEVRELTSLVYTRMAEYSLDEEPEQALRFAERALSIRPFSEDACEMAMKALIRLKMPERAKKLYEDFTEQFKNELKMESRLGWPPD